jgi:hypothetical protein
VLWLRSGSGAAATYTAKEVRNLIPAGTNWSFGFESTAYGGWGQNYSTFLFDDQSIVTLAYNTSSKIQAPVYVKKL